MKIPIKLSASVRATLKETLAEMNALSSTHREVLAEKTRKMERLLALHKEAVALEKSADSGDIEASQKALAVQDQISRVRVFLNAGNAADEVGDVRTQGEIDLLREVNLAALRALNIIKDARRPLLKVHLEALTELIAPFFEIRYHAQCKAEEFHSYNSLIHAVGTVPHTNHVTQEGAFAQLEMRRQTIEELLSGTGFEFHGSEAPALESAAA